MDPFVPPARSRRRSMSLGDRSFAGCKLSASGGLRLITERRRLGRLPADLPPPGDLHQEAAAHALSAESTARGFHRWP
jgi:hypothetical protein